MEDFLVIGGGIAGLTAGAHLARHGTVVVLEAESALGFHASSRSAALIHRWTAESLVREPVRSTRIFRVSPRLRVPA